MRRFEGTLGKNLDIGFSYAPYENGPYSLGSIELILPWKDVIDDLKPDTKVHEMAAKFVGKAKE
ncbi:MAG: hypothetical protein RIS79_846 [Verrucomicrobiota bacterium]